jgi:hypothetical protein
MHKAQRWKGELLSNKLTEMRDSGALACSIKCKWENQLKKTEPTS